VSFRWSALVPSILAAAGILVGTQVSVLALDTGAWPLAGPVVLAALLVAAGVVGERLDELPRGGLAATVILAGAVVVSCGIVAARDPARVPDLLPIIGAGAAFVVVCGQGRCGRRCA